MKRFIVLALMVSVVLISGKVMAAEPFIDQLGDVLTGRHDQCATYGYVAYTTKDVVRIKDFPVLPRGLRLKASTALGQDFLEDNRVDIGIEF